MAIELELRPLLFAIAYRMTGSVTDADDIVQESFLRWHGARRDGVEIESPKAFLTAVTTRLCIDHARSSRVRREHYVGTWLPEPLVTGEHDPAERVELSESLSMAFLVLLETLSPVERAVFVLHDVFAFSYCEIAGIVDKSEPNCRQLAVRARRRLEQRRPRFTVSAAERDRLARRFFAAFDEGDTDGLVATLAADVAFYGDGGGKAAAVPAPLHGRAQVGRLLGAFATHSARLGSAPEYVLVNDQPGALFRDRDGGLINVVVLDLDDGSIVAVRSIVNPDKLRHLGPLSRIPELKRTA